MGSLKEQDEPLHTEITADVRKDMQSEYNRSKPKKMDVLLTPGVTTGEKFEQVLEQWVKQTMEGSNITKLTLDNVASPDDIGGPDNIEIIEGDRFNPFSNATILPDFGAMVRFPTFLPIIVLPMMMRSTEITPAEVKIITENIFTADILTNVTVESMGLSVTIRGIPAEGKTLKEVYDIALKRVSLFPGLKDRVRLFMLPDYMNPNEVAMSPFSPNGRTSSSRMKTSEKYSTNKFEPVFLLLSRSAKPRELGNVEYATALLSFLATCITSLIYSVDLNSFNNGFMQQVQEADPEIISKAFFIAGGLIIVQLFHEIGHYLAAFFHKTKLSIPWFIPSLQIGYFGSIVNFLDFPKTRKELFDISISGPLLGFIVSLACTVIGLELTQSATTDVAATFPSIPTGFLTSSLFIYELVDSFLHVSNTIVNANNIIDPQAATAIHPLVAIGIAGLLANAFNCLPIGRLDGGRVAMSIFGRKSAQTINFFALLSQALSLFFNSSPLTFFWSLYVFFLQRGQDIPPEDDVSPIASSEDDEKKGTLWAGRLASLIFCALLASAILLPLPKELITSAANQPLNIDNFIGTSI
jgi:membrane-associated protease RseP (regulator of RpoE activity)